MRYRSKPVECDAIQWTSTNSAAVSAWAGSFIQIMRDSDGWRMYVKKSNTFCDLPAGTYIVREPDDASAFYPCQESIFESRWELDGEAQPES